MKKRPVVLGITPARGGSKSVPRKNIKPIAGKPLIAWTAAHAKESERLDRWVVSTEDAEIAKVSRRFGADIVVRPKALATDTADTLPVLQHALKQFPADIVVLLQCTSPIRRPGLIDLCVESFIASKADSLATIFEDRTYEYGQDMPRRQEIAPRLLDNGNVYVMRADLLAKGDRYGRRIATLSVSREETVEIDDPFDFWLAESVLRERPPHLWRPAETRLRVAKRP